MNRGRKLVSLSLQDKSDLSFEEGNSMVSSKIVQEDELIQPEDYGFNLSSALQNTTSDILEYSLFEQYNDEILTGSNVPIPITDFNDDDSFIENSRDMSYVDLQCPAKRPKLMNISKNSDVSSEGRIVSEKPIITILETPSNSESESDTTNHDIFNNEVNDIQQIKPQRQERKDDLKFPHYSKEERVARSKAKHPMLTETCGSKCKRECKEFNIYKRTNIWEAYWTMTHDSQIKWLARYIHLHSIKANRYINHENAKFKKNESRNFFLPFNDGTVKQVCKKFFLNTFGYGNDSIVTTISRKLKGNTTLSLSDKRGTHDKPKIDTSVIEDFINLYKPCTAHYRRHNAPNMKYLGQDVTVEKLYSDFQELYPDFKCCKEIIRRTLKDMHISLHRPKSDKCFDCLSYETSIAESLKANNIPSLKLLCKKVIHTNKAKEATDAYKYDTNKQKNIDEIIYSMDLQKSILLPMMPDVKDCFFTNRMIGLNLTFCGLSKDSIEGSKCIVWHEATGGRDGKDIVDAIYTFIHSERDVKHFTFWADNCCAQNKNWILFTALVTIVNFHHDIKSITLKYLTKGHTHMSADGVHGNIEKNLKRTKNIYDFKDYKECIEKSRKRNVVIEVTSEEKRVWEKKKKARMDPIILTDLV